MNTIQNGSSDEAHARPRVLRLITRLNIGGPARQALLLTKELSARYPTVLGAGTPPQDEGELLDPEVSVTRLPLVRPISPPDDVRALVAIRTLLKRLRPEIVHTHTAKAGLVGRVATASVRRRPRTVHTFHGHVLEGYFSKAVTRTFIETERRLAHRTDVLVAVSPEVRDSLLSLRVGTPDQYRVIPLGFDLTRHLSVETPSGQLRERLKLDGSTPLIGVVGRLAPIKDVSTLLRAVALLPDVHLAVLGDGELREELQRETASLGLVARVHFVGWWLDIPAAISDMNCIALSSKNEGTPVALIESLACGRPVVATDVGGVRFVVDDGETGLLCPPGSPEALAEELRSVLADPKLARDLATEGRARVRSRFHKDRLVRDIAALYAELSSR